MISLLTKRVFTLMFFLIAVSGCAPKRGEIHSVEQPLKDGGATIIMMREDAILGSAVRFYPTINGKKIAGLYPHEHINFHLPDGKYRLGIAFPLVGSNAWRFDEVELDVYSNQKYYFLLSSKMFSGVEIKLIKNDLGAQKLSNSTLVKTGTSSNNSNPAATILNSLGLGEDERN